LIKEENVKVQLGARDTRLEALKKECEQYEAYVQTLREARARGLPGAVPDSAGISDLIKNLYAMKHYGKNLQKVANVVSKAYEATFRETAYHVRPKNYWMRARGRSGNNFNSHGPTRPTGKVYHGSGQPYSTMLDVGPSSSKPKAQPSRSSTSYFDISKVLGKKNQSQNSPDDDDDKAFQHMYDEIITPKRPEPKKPAVKGFLPFDDISDEGYGSAETPDVSSKPSRVFFPTDDSGPTERYEQHDQDHRPVPQKNKFSFKSMGKKISNSLHTDHSDEHASARPHGGAKMFATQEPTEPPPSYEYSPPSQMPDSSPVDHGEQKKSKRDGLRKKLFRR
jgi:hypothetical protein